MILAMTMMVRDEADIVVPVIEYHLDAGVDLLLITDNGSVDGTREILAAYEGDERVIVMDDPIHDKNQSRKVSAMARRAATDFGADWVINADADEFFVPRDRTLRLRDLFTHMPREIGSATIPVIDMTGTPARRGSGLNRLTLRDERPLEDLYAQTGLHAHSTHDSFHVGSPDVVVAQGNHYVSIPSRSSVPPELMFESLHFPWRSFAQFERKVRNAGEAYARNPELRPSPRHHGIRDYRFFRAGVLEDLYLFRHPLDSDSAGLHEDRWLADHLVRLAGGSARNAAGLLAALEEPADADYSESELRAAASRVPALLMLEAERAAAETEARQASHAAEEARRRDTALMAELDELRQERLRLAARLDHIYRSRAYRFARRMSRFARVPLDAMRALWAAVRPTPTTDRTRL